MEAPGVSPPAVSAAPLGRFAHPPQSSLLDDITRSSFKPAPPAPHSRSPIANFIAPSNSTAPSPPSYAISYAPATLLLRVPCASDRPPSMHPHATLPHLANTTDVCRGPHAQDTLPAPQCSHRCLPRNNKKVRPRPSAPHLVMSVLANLPSDPSTPYPKRTTQTPTPRPLPPPYSPSSPNHTRCSLMPPAAPPTTATPCASSPPAQAPTRAHRVQQAAGPRLGYLSGAGHSADLLLAFTAAAAGATTQRSAARHMRRQLAARGQMQSNSTAASIQRQTRGWAVWDREVTHSRTLSTSGQRPILTRRVTPRRTRRKIDGAGSADGEPWMRMA